MKGGSENRKSEKLAGKRLPSRKLITAVETLVGAVASVFLGIRDGGM